LLGYARYATAIFLGVVVTGIAVSFVQQIHKNSEVWWWAGIKKTIKSYLKIFAIGLITLLSSLVVMKATQYFNILASSFKLSFIVNYGISIVLQSFLVVAIPAVIIENRKFGSALFRSLAMFKNYPITIFLLLFIANAVFIPLIYIFAKIPFLMDRFMPEIVLYLSGLRLFVSTIVDMIVTIAITLLFLMHKEYEKKDEKTA
jgi:hypothetical protein